jgi:ABC-type transport system substrate-binding protein
VDELILKAKTAKNEREAKRYWRDFQKAVTEDMVIYIPAVGGNSQAISDKVKGVKLYPYTGLIDLEGAYLSK